MAIPMASPWLGITKLLVIAVVDFMSLMVAGRAHMHRTVCAALLRPLCLPSAHCLPLITFHHQVLPEAASSCIWREEHGFGSGLPSPVPHSWPLACWLLGLGV